MPYFDVRDVLSTAITIIDEHGYSSSKTSNKPTWKLVDNYIQSHISKSNKDPFIKHIDVKTNDESLKIIEWSKSLKDSTHYKSLVKQVIDRGYCGKHLFGLLISIIPIYRRKNINHVL